MVFWIYTFGCRSCLLSYNKSFLMMIGTTGHLCMYSRLVTVRFSGGQELFNMCYQKDRWRRQWHPTPVLFPGESCGWRSLVGCSPWGRQESDTTERLHFHFSLSCIGGGNGKPLQCSCLQNPSDGGAWWAAICGVTQSWTRLKQLSSSSSSRRIEGG